MSKIEHLVTLQSPNGGLYKSRIICCSTEVYICNGTRFVYVFSIEKKKITAVYQFPSDIWHIELSRASHQLYVLCAQNGLYLLEWDEHGRLLREPSSVTSKGDMTVYQIGSSFGLLIDPSLCAFTVVSKALVVALAQQDKWKIAVFQKKSLNPDDRFTAPSREVTFSYRGGMNSGDLQPVLCCVSMRKDKPMSTQCNVALEAVLFTRLFGVDVAMLDSPMILCGFPDGQVVTFPLKGADVHSTNQRTTQGSLKLLYHLEQPVVSIGTIKMKPCGSNTERPPEENTACDCVVVVGQRGLVLSVTGGDNSDAISCAYKDYRLPAPVCCTSHSTSGVFCCTSSDLIYVTRPSLEKEAATNAMCSTVTSIRHNIPMIVGLSPVSLLDDTQLVALSKRGRLMLCKLNQKGSKDQQHGLGCVNTGQRIRELLSGIGSVSERSSALKIVADEKSRSLARLNHVMSLSRELLSGQWTTCPVRCAIRVCWTQMLLKDYIIASCSLQNKSDYILEHGWTLCLLISTDPITSYSFPILLLKPGETKEFAFPLYGQRLNSLDFPITISCSLFYSLKGFVADCDKLSELYLSFSHKQGVYIPLQEHDINILQCLRLGSSTTYCSGLPHTLLQNAVSAVWKSPFRSDQLGTPPKALVNQGPNHTMPLRASVRLSAMLLTCALKNEKSEMSLCSVVLHWLLPEVLVKEQDVQEVKGSTPDGKKFCIRVQEISVSDLLSEGSIQAIEVEILSSHLHVVASLHLAVLSRFKILFQDKPNSECHSPDLNLGKIQQLFSAHELLIKEVKNLRERLVMDEDIISSAAAQRLLDIYRDLRDPGLLFI
ncbi:Fanconi anemia core complex-associated protein 100 isoform X1 [Bufo bufo]|uniref:Fanconi anemia core complex-associated protein 100 isoform X1 n=2 Tax=Bufo bufo TaxID=8384 RepID=UPI001ABE0A51|nr:Fanconi anemia core complex-associated protein 100 isoform X1 [Bufo bufo]XP_040294774.1 Fanconi anemia core complex-associated protein 100 isoform X1 [Bufo bufo]